MIRALSLCWLCLLGWSFEAWQRPRLLTVAASVQKDWRALYSADPGWVAARLDHIEAVEPERWPLLLVARLMYDGEAWQRRVGRSRSAVGSGAPRPPHANIRAAILRTLRWSAPQPSFAGLYEVALQRPWPSNQRLMLLDLLAQIDAATAQTRARKLADPAVNPTYPGLRVACQHWLFERGGLQGNDDNLVDRILTHGTFEERLLLLRLLPDALMAGRLPAMVHELLHDADLADLDAERKALIQAACQRLGSAPIDPMLADLLRLLREGRRAELTVLAGALADLPSGSLSAKVRLGLVEALRLRIGTASDMALRHALLGVLAAWDPAVVLGLVGHRDAWAAIVRHRKNLGP